MGGCNDFATLLNIFEQCKARYNMIPDNNWLCIADSSQLLMVLKYIPYVQVYVLICNCRCISYCDLLFESKHLLFKLTVSGCARLPSLYHCDKNTGNFLPSLYKGLLYNTSISVPSKSPSAWCHKYWIHWRAVKSALSVEKQLREITSKLKQVRKYTANQSDASLYLRLY